MTDAARGQAIGPFWIEDEVSRELGRDDCICAYGFPVKPKNQIRGCDDYCRNHGNDTSERSGKLDVSSTD